MSYLASDLAQSVSRQVGLDRYFESCHHCFPPYCHTPSLTASPPVALPFKAPHNRRRLSHPQPFTHAKTTIVSQHGCHFHPSFLVVEWETTCRKTQKIGEENMENNSSLNSEKNNQNSFFLFSEKKPLENTENTKNKNHPISYTSFQCFLFSRTKNGSWKQQPNRPIVFSNNIF